MLLRSIAIPARTHYYLYEYNVLPSVAAKCCSVLFGSLLFFCFSRFVLSAGTNG